MSDISALGKSKKEETKSKGLSSSPTVGEGVMSGSVVA